MLLLKLAFRIDRIRKLLGVKIFTLLLLSGTILFFVFCTLIGGYLKLIIYFSLCSIRREPSVYIFSGEWAMTVTNNTENREGKLRQTFFSRFTLTICLEKRSWHLSDPIINLTNEFDRFGLNNCKHVYTFWVLTNIFLLIFKNV